MLIPSGRHTPADLDLWAEFAEADRLVGTRFLRSARLDESRRAICEFVGDGLAYGAVSWGKESVALAHLLWGERRDVPLVHLRPTNHNPDCDVVRDAYFSMFPGQPYEEISVDYGRLHAAKLPDHRLDRETDARWYAAIGRSEKSYGGRRLTGIRSGESFGRMIRTLRWGLSTPNACAPLARWTLAEVYGYLAAHDLPIHPAYAMLGGGRWPRERLRVAEIGDTHGKGSGRADWEREYYGDVLRRLESGHLG